MILLLQTKLLGYAVRKTSKEFDGVLESSADDVVLDELAESYLCKIDFAFIFERSVFNFFEEFQCYFDIILLLLYL